jgi:very-short-patch-repair endonuclease
MGFLPRGQARTFADRALQQGWVALDDMTRRLETQRGRWGNRQIRQLMTQIGDGAAAESERLLHRILRQAGITGWVANLQVATVTGQRFEIDVAFPAIKLAIEVDGFAYHSGDDRFQGDRTKQNALLASGWRVLRFTWADLDQRPQHVVRQILTLLAA